MRSAPAGRKTTEGGVLYVLTRFPVLTETFILNELREMRRQGLPYDVFTFRLDHEMAAKAPCDRIPAHELPRPWSLPVLSANLRPWTKGTYSAISLLRARTCRRARHLLQGVYLARWVARRGIRHIHAHYAYHSTSVAAVAARLAGIGYSFTAHANDIYKSPWKMEEKIAWSRFCVTCTEYNALYLRRHHAQGCPEKVLRVYHGIDLDRFAALGPAASGESSGPLKILSVGRLREKKGFPVLIHACSLLRKRGLAVEASIVGEGPDYNALEGLISTEGLGDAVRLAGALPHDEVRALLARADLFALPCVIAKDGSRDGIPNVILEAMAVGLPVVSTTISAIPEAVSNGDTGLLVPPGDAEALADAIGLMAKAPDMRRRMGEAGRRKVREGFDLATNTERLVALFQKALRA